MVDEITQDGLGGDEEQRVLLARRSKSDRRKTVSGESAGEAHQHKGYGKVFPLLSSIIIALIGVAVYVGSGLYEGAGPTFLKVSLGTVLVCCYLVAFRRGFYSR